MKKFLGLIFLITWVAGEAPRLWWKEAVPARPMDAAAGLLFLAEIIGNKNYKSYKNIGLIIAALAGSLILGPYAARTLVYGWLIWRGGEIFGGVRKWIMPAMASFLILGLGQYVFFPDTRFLLQYGWDEHYYRLVGTVLDPNYFGVMAGMILLFSMQVSRRLSRWRKFARSPSPSLTLGQAPRWRSGWPQTAAVSLANLPTSIAVSVRNLWLMISKTPSSIRLLALLSFISLVLTFSRASWLAFAAAMGWWGLSGKSGRLGRLRKLGILGVLGIFGVMVWWVAPKPGGEGVNLMRTSSIEQRLVSWNQAIEVWKQHPWMGAGFKDYGSGLPSSSWLVILEATGILGVIVIGSLVISYWRRMDNFWKGMAIMVGFHAIFNNTLFYPPVLGLVAMMRAIDDL